MTTIAVKVIYDDACGTDVEVICERAAEQGLKVEQVMPMLCAIFGSCDDSVLGDLAKLEGVLRVSPEGTVQLPPLSPDIPQ
ncbi:hypothetical protein KUV51_11025 [Tateyamaria omphalii]|uniref:hypothetical protein n=1 Tax=Tateyamaria omphalii TaxID=299262 RepID=UPI001C99191C|nr:hypothetical protein [Tateyamaria omphalii]MBY5933532.1 hypothetical protein [Tateyamaria omphalii]